YLVRGKLHLEEKNPFSRASIALYTPILRVVLRRPWITLSLVLLILVATTPLLTGLKLDLNGDGEPEMIIEPLGSEFMPALDEGSILYMPVTLPSVSITEAKRLMQLT